MKIQNIHGVAILRKVENKDLINGTIVIPASVTSIDDEALWGCISLTHIVIPTSVTAIGKVTFFNCSSLISIVIPDSVTAIGDAAFFGCSSLTSIVISNSVTSIGNETFYDCNSLASIVIPNSVAFIGNEVFHGCRNLTSIVIPDSMTAIGDRAFFRCSSLTSAVIPNSVTSIGNEAFYNCRSLTSIVISNSVTSISNKAFYGCSNLANIVIPDSVTSIGHKAFSYCHNLTSIVIPNSVVFIGNYAFYDCSNLVSIVIPDSVNAIGYAAFPSNLNHICIDTEDNARFNAIKALLPEELREKVIDFNIASQVRQLKKQILLDAALACHPLESLPSSRNMDFLVRNVLDYESGYSREPIRSLKEKMELQPIECHTQEEFETYKQQLKQIHFDFQLQLTRQRLKSYLKVLEKQIPQLFFSSSPKQTENQKTLAVFRLIERLIDSLEKNEGIQISEEERELLQERPLLLSKIPKEVQHVVGITQEQSNKIKMS